MLSQVFSHNGGPRFAHKKVATPWGAEGNASHMPVDEVSSHGGGGLCCPVVSNNGGMISGIIIVGVNNGTIGNFTSNVNVGLPNWNSAFPLDMLLNNYPKLPVSPKCNMKGNQNYA